MTDSRARAGRQASALFVVGVARALLAVAVLDRDVAALLALALAEAVFAAVALVVPWHRLPRSSSLLLAVPGFAALAATEGLGLVPLRALGVPFVVVFAWVGAYHRRGSSLLLAPVAALAYAVPMVVDGPGIDVRALLLTVAGCVLVAEVIAYAMDVADRHRAQAEQAARVFGAVARASAGLHDLDPDRVLDVVTKAVLDLGYDDASLVRAERASGDPGAVGEAWRTEQAVVASGALEGDGGSEGLVVAVPVFSRRRLVGVLCVTSARRRTVPEEEVEAMRVLATTAGTALGNARQFLAERTTSQRHAAAAVTDPLTRVGNRRYAAQLLADLAPGDSVVMVDLDHFKAVNDRLGHAAGDVVLCDLADHLVAGLRGTDQVARYGGEEFLLVLKASGEPRAEGTVERLIGSWRQRQPASTFSAGVAHHQGGDAAATVERADRALYAAKAAGRDTWCVSERGLDLPAQRTAPTVTRRG